MSHPSSSSSTVQSLRDLSETCSEPSWDCQGATPVDPMMIVKAIQDIQSWTRNDLLPGPCTIYPTPLGGVRLSFDSFCVTYQGNKKTLSLRCAVGNEDECVWVEATEPL